MENINNNNKFRSFALRIIIPTLLTICLFILTIFYIIIPRVQENIMNGKREMIKELTNSAWSILAKYENDERTGILTREEAQKTAISRIQYLRYGDEGKDYFWISDSVPCMIMHPYRPDLNGKNLSEFSDPHGKKIFVEFAYIVKKQQHGFVEYMWQWKDDSTQIVPKLSYVKGFTPWHWIIGTGIYIEDVDKEINSLTNKLIKISAGIALLIALLLLFIIQQSFKIDKLRRHTEDELHQSKEKYKKLVEAANEGLMMVIDMKIVHSNKKINEMVGYNEFELDNTPINDIINENNNRDILKLFKNDRLKDGQFEINLKSKNGETIEVLMVVSSMDFFDQKGYIIVVRNITVEANALSFNIDYKKLINTLNFGLFRISLDYKGRFINANETAVQIFGYNNFNEISKIHVLDMFNSEEDRKHIRNLLLKNGYVKEKILKLIKKDGTAILASISIVLLNRESGQAVLCDGIIEDITDKETDKMETLDLIAELQNQKLYAYSSVKDFIKQPVSIDLNAPIGKALSLITKSKKDEILITKDDIHFVGILTKSDFISRVLLMNLNLDNPVYIAMTSPLVNASENILLNEAILLAQKNNIKRLVIKNENDSFKGILNINDILFSVQNSLSILKHQIENADTDDEIVLCQKRLIQLIRPYIESDVNAKFITKITSSFADDITRRLIELAINEIGEPPVKFAFIVLGSVGRMEQTLATDQDNAIIYEDVSKENEDYTQKYFLKLAGKVCTSLNKTGYALCKGNIMAMNPKWCVPLKTWRNHYKTWIISPEPQNLLDAMIFFDLRTVFGDDKFVMELKNLISQTVNDNSVFTFHMANYIVKYKIAQSVGGTGGSDKNAEFYDFKNVITPLIIFARLYALKHSILDTNTLGRLKMLNEKQLISATTYEEIKWSYNYLMQMRYKHQLALIQNDQLPNNFINMKGKNEIENILLKKIISQIYSLQSLLTADFKINI